MAKDIEIAITNLEDKEDRAEIETYLNSLKELLGDNLTEEIAQHISETVTIVFDAGYREGHYSG